MDFDKINGQEYVKRALEVALTGKFSVLLIGCQSSPSIELSRAVQAIDKNLQVEVMLSCPCGRFTDPKAECKCTPWQIQRHLAKYSLIYRKSVICVEVPATTNTEKKRHGESSKEVKARVKSVKITKYKTVEYIELTKDAEEILKTAILDLGLSALAYDNVLKIARVIADMDKKDKVEAHHISEAISYRCLDRSMW